MLTDSTQRYSPKDCEPQCLVGPLGWLGSRGLTRDDLRPRYGDHMIDSMFTGYFMLFSTCTVT